MYFTVVVLSGCRTTETSKPPGHPGHRSGRFPGPLFQRLIRRVQREPDGAEDDSFRPDRRGRKLGVRMQTGRCAAAAEGRQVTDPGQATADDDPLRVHGQRHLGRVPGQHLAEVVNDLECVRLARPGRTDDLLGDQVVPFGHRVGGGHRAEQTDLARGAAEAAVHPAAEDQARADPPVDQQIDEVVDVLGLANEAPE